MRACTLTTRARWPEVRVLADSLAGWAPAVTLTAVLIDGDPPAATAGSAQIDLRPFAWLADELTRRSGDDAPAGPPAWRVRAPDPNDDVEALRWHLADVLFDEFGEVLVLDPATELTGPLSHVWPERPIVAFPRRHHRRSASEVTGAAIGPTDQELATIGVLDDGIVLLRPPAFHHRTWRSGPGWLSVALFGNVVGLAEPPRSRFAADSPSPFFRTPGFAVDRPWLWCESGDPSVADTPSIRALLEQRAERLRVAGESAVVATGSWYDARSARIAAASWASGEPVPDPWFKPDEFRSWLCEPVGGVNRYLRSVCDERDDLREAFAGIDLDPHATAAYLEWARNFAESESGVPGWLVPSAEDVAAAEALAAGYRVAPARRTGGVRVVGYLGATLGLGVAARDLIHALVTIGEDVSTLDYRHIRADGFDWTDLNNAPGHDVAILAVNGAELPRLLRALGPDALAGRVKVGLWFWECDRLPLSWLEGLAALDEVWVTSEWTAAAIRAAEPSASVHVLPLGMSVPPALRDRDVLGLPDDLPIALATWDYASAYERKNPLGLIDAWRRAFPAPGQAVLVCKTLNATRVRHDSERVRVAAADRSDIVFVDEVLPDDEQHTLMASVDAYVSLHRAEGYGLGALEALARGLPLICTDATGTQEFTSPGTTWLVPASPWLLDHDAGPYPTGTRWFDPDLDVAAAHLRTVLLSPDAPEVRARAERGVASVQSLVSGERAAGFLRSRLTALRNR